MVRKLLMLFLVAVLAVPVAGCGGPTAEDEARLESLPSPDDSSEAYQNYGKAGRKGGQPGGDDGGTE